MKTSAIDSCLGTSSKLSISMMTSNKFSLSDAFIDCIKETKNSDKTDFFVILELILGFIWPLVQREQVFQLRLFL